MLLIICIDISPNDLLYSYKTFNGFFLSVLKYTLHFNFFFFFFFLRSLLETIYLIVRCALT